MTKKLDDLLEGVTPENTHSETDWGPAVGNEFPNIQIRASDALVVIDIQNDFCPGGPLGVPGGDEIIPGVNALMAHFRQAGGIVALTQDWHPQSQISFASNHEGGAAFTMVEVGYGNQVLWPDHCVQGTFGAEFKEGLDTIFADVIIHKGADPAVDSHSAFYENDHKTPTGLGGYLKARGITRVFCVGLATDFCVGFSAVDAAFLDGFQSVVVEDLCRAIDLNGSLDAIKKSFADNGVELINSTDIASMKAKETHHAP